ncbi:MAG TPA: hypothetical protein VFQ00_02155 [Terriglobales bacterium]|nr:hypothetical protein [Terriglobales bacterium]
MLEKTPAVAPAALSLTVKATLLGRPTTTLVGVSAIEIVAERGATRCVTAGEELVRNFVASPELYVAVIECEPTPSVKISNVAVDEVVTGVNAMVPMGTSKVLPLKLTLSKKVTLPVGAPLALPGTASDTVAVNVADWPSIEVVGELIAVAVSSVAA